MITRTKNLRNQSTAMLLRLFFTAVFFITTNARDYRGPASDKMQPCQCWESFSRLHIRCEDAEVVHVLEALINVTHLQKSIDLTLERIGLVNLSSNLLQGLHFNHLAVLHCNLSSVDENAFAEVADALEWLSFNHNALERVPSEALETLSVLKYLYLEYNRLEVLHAEAFKSLYSVIKVSLLGNRIKIIDGLAFEGIGNNFVNLNLGENELTAIPLLPLSNLSSLQVLGLPGNRIITLQTEGLDFMDVHLTRLSLANNTIRQLPPGAFMPLRKLTTLDLSGNVIEFIHPFAFQGTKDTLKYLYLGHNRLDKVPSMSLKNMSRLMFIDLQDNKIVTVQKDDFLPHGKRLKYIHLQNNSLTFVHPESFVCLTALEFLWLQANQLGTAPYETYAPLLDRLSEFDIHDNPLHCDCEVSWLGEWMRGNRSDVILSKNETKCAGPEVYAGMALAEIPEDQLLCPNTTSSPLRSCGSKPTSDSRSLSSGALTMILQMSFTCLAIAVERSGLF